MAEIVVIGAGLAGCEAAWRAAQMGIRVTLYEMKPTSFSPAHKNKDMAELVCSNSLKSESLDNASGLLKKELERIGSLIIEAAHHNRVPAGSALAVDRGKFSQYITEKITAHPRIDVIRQEVTTIKTDVPTIIATGPLTSHSLAEEIGDITGRDKLFFYDAISPIIYAESINMNIAFRGSRYDKGGDDYVNLPMTKDEYYRFIREVKRADSVEPHSFEDIKIFEGCLPIEVMIRRGDETLAFGPLKPVGLVHPESHQMPYAVVQLRQENIEGTLYNMVGFQTRLKRDEQERIFRMIPGLENAQFARFGSIHRNTFIHAPHVLLPTLEVKKRSNLLIAGQLVGVEGYVESAAMGVLAGINASLIALGDGPVVPPRDTAIGSLVSYITGSRNINFQPMNINFGLFPDPPPMVRKKDKKKYIVNRAIESIEVWLNKLTRCAENGTIF